MKTVVGPDAINGKSAFIIAPMEPGWLVTVHRLGLVAETIPAETRAEACRLTRRLTDSGLIGYIMEVPPWTTPTP